MNLVTSTYVSRVGRLGNSLMQIATALAYGLDHGKKPVFTKWDYQNYIPLELIPEGTQWNRVAEHGLTYKPLEKADGDVDVHGHFLSQQYFMHHRDEILKVIKLKPEYDKYIEDKYGELLKGETCSIHVRRADYLQEEQMRCHGVLDFEWYKTAQSWMWSSMRRTKYIICSDDIEWCKQHFGKEDYKGTYHYIEDEKDIIDLFIMRKCKGHIIANSTFSWWAAWLSGNKTVAPINWFVDGGWDGLYRDNWIKI